MIIQTVYYLYILGVNSLLGLVWSKIAHIFGAYF